MNKLAKSAKTTTDPQKTIFPKSSFRKDDWNCLTFMLVYYTIWTVLIISGVLIVVYG